MGFPEAHKDLKEKSRTGPGAQAGMVQGQACHSFRLQPYTWEPLCGSTALWTIYCFTPGQWVRSCLTSF